MMAPAIGGPVSVAKLTIVKTMPIRVPDLRRSVVRLLRPAGKSDWIPPAAMPKNTAHAYRPGGLDTAIQVSWHTPAISAVGTKTLMAPHRSARWFGTRRPIMPMPFRSSSRFSEST